MAHFSCPKCGEPYDAFPPDDKHRKVSKFPDRNTIPVTNKCNICVRLIESIGELKNSKSI